MKHCDQKQRFQQGQGWEHDLPRPAPTVYFSPYQDPSPETSTDLKNVPGAEAKSFKSWARGDISVSNCNTTQAQEAPINRNSHNLQIEVKNWAVRELPYLGLPGDYTISGHVTNPTLPIDWQLQFSTVVSLDKSPESADCMVFLRMKMELVTCLCGVISKSADAFLPCFISQRLLEGEVGKEMEMCSLGVLAVSGFPRKPPAIKCGGLPETWRREEYESEGIWRKRKINHCPSS